jgi:DNA-binding transcriptional LysR family regulator
VTGVQTCALPICYPGIATTLRVTRAEEVARLVEDGGADIGFAFATHPLAGLRALHREPHALGAVLAVDHRLAGSATLRLDDLVGEPLILPARGLSLRAALDPALARLGRSLVVRGESDSLRLTAALVRRAAGVGFMTRVGIERDCAAGELVWVPLADEDLLPDHLEVVARERAVPSLAVAALCDFIEESWGPQAPR